jgi:hypothetical protein
MNIMEVGRPPVPVMKVALYVTNGRVDKAQKLLVEMGYTCTRLGMYTRLRTKGLQQYAKDLRVAARRHLDDDPYRCRWGFGRSCTDKVADTRVDFCPKHQEQHNAYIRKVVADRKRRGVCVTCEKRLAKTSKIHCPHHLAIANQSSYRSRERRARKASNSTLM